MNKAHVLKQITDSLKASLVVLHAAAHTAHTEATDETSRAENKYDTRSLEAGYLAQGQARQVRELADAITCFESLEPRDFASGEPVDLTAIVDLDVDGTPATYFLGPKSGGLEVTLEGRTLVVITPSSPLGQALMGKTTGQTWTARMAGHPVKYRILAVR